MVLESTTIAPGFSDSIAPSLPNNVCSTAAVSETHSHTISTSLAASFGVAAERAPSTFLPGVRFQTLSSCPALTRFSAMGLPMIPSPRNAIFIACSYSANYPRLLKASTTEDTEENRGIQNKFFSPCYLCPRWWTFGPQAAGIDAISSSRCCSFRGSSTGGWQVKPEQRTARLFFSLSLLAGRLGIV